MLAIALGAFFLYVAGEGKLSSYIGLLKKNSGTQGNITITTASGSTSTGLYPVKTASPGTTLTPSTGVVGYGSDGNYGVQQNAQ